MAEERKFLFEVSFDEPKPQAAVEEETPEEVAEVEAAPSYSDADMQAARDKAFAEGKAEGVAEAAEATEQAILGVLEQIEAHFTELFQAEEESQSAVTEDAIVVAVGIVRKIFPSLNERQAQAEMERMVRTAMERILEDPKVVVYVAPDLVDPLNARLETLATQAAYKGEVEVIAHADIPKGDCRVEWTGGGASRVTDELWQEIDEIVERNLARTDDEHLIEAPDAVADLAPPPAGAPGVETPDKEKPEGKAEAMAGTTAEAPATTDAEATSAEAAPAMDAATPEKAVDALAETPDAEDAGTGAAPPADAATPEEAFDALAETPDDEAAEADAAPASEDDIAATPEEAPDATPEDDAPAPDAIETGTDAPAGDDEDTDREQP